MKRFFLFLLSTLLFISCNDATDAEKRQDQQNEMFKFRAHVNQVSDDILSTREPIVISFTEPVQGWTDGKELDASLISFDPGVKGTLVATGPQSVSFQPEKPLQQDTEYEVTFELGKIKEVSDDLEEFSFYFKTLAQDFIVSTEPVGAYSRDYQYVEGSIRTSDILETENAQKILSANMEGKPLNIKFDDSTPLGKYFSFRIDSIKRPTDDAQIELAWDGDIIGVEEKGANNIMIPGKNSFSVTDVELVNGESQYILVNFSDPLKKNQNLDGLVQIQGVDQLRFERSGTELRVYPSIKVNGSKKVEIFEGIQNIDGYKLKNAYSKSIAFEQIAPSVLLIRSGTILPSSQNSKINFMAVNLNAVDVWVYKIYENNVLQFLQNNNLDATGNLRNVARPVGRKVVDLKGLGTDISRWNTYSVDLAEVIAADPGAIYRVELKYQLAYSAYKCEYTAENQPIIEEVNFDQSVESSSWDNVQDYYQDDYYDYDWRDSDDPCSHSFYRNKSMSFNILASDLGVTVKKGSGSEYLVAVSNLITAKPLGGAQVLFYNFQQQEIASSRTDTQGLLTIQLESPAFFVKVIYKNQVSYMRMDDGNTLSTSKFHTSGRTLQKGIKGYIYGERGVWRPGDHIYLTFVLNNADNNLPAKHPVKLELFNPNGKLVVSEVQKAGLNNFYQFDLKTDDTSPTGNWNARVEVGGAVFNKTLKIETIKPNRLKINLEVKNDLIKSGEDWYAEIKSKWLHGATAKNLRATTSVKLYPTTTKFAKYDSYVFDDPSRHFDLQEEEIFEGKLDDVGEALVEFYADMDSESPGMLKASFLTKVYENGGDFSTNVTTKNYSPYNTYVGIDAPPGDKQRGMLLTDTDHTFDVVTLDQEGKAKSVDNLEVSVYKVNWRWWWQSQAQSLSRYEASEYREEVYNTTLDTGSNGKAQFKFNIKYPEWGRYLVRVYDPESGHATGKIVFIDWPGWAGKSRKVDPEMASMLVFTADKEKYKVGEQAKVTFPSSAGGRALITVENGSEILAAQWAETSKEKTTVSIPLDNTYVPNVFIHITYLQPHAQTANDLPLRMYGVIPLLVENKSTHLEPQIKMPDELAPNSTVKITVSEKNDRPMTYTLAVVDEGLLDLTNFKTPNAWDDFFAREALGVKTWDMYDDVIGAYGGRIDAAFAIGGDGSAAASKAKKANRFEPMVVHIGPFELAAGENKTHQISIPQYVGSVRTMVVAGNNNKEAYGNAEETTPVRKPLMMLASLPRKLSPGETVKLPVTVFAMDKKVRNVSVELANSPYFEFQNGNKQQLSFTETGDQIAYFDLKVKNATGVAILKLNARGNGEQASFQTEIDVVNPNPFTTISEKAVIKPGQTATIPIQPFGTRGSNASTITLSSLPPMNLGKRLNYLVRYPHGCVEQTTSAAFPQLHLTKVVDLTTKQEKDVSRNVKAAIKKLGHYQKPNGGFSYWPSGGSVNDWGTSYAGHFLIEAEQAGYVVPIAFKSNWILYQKRAAKEWRYNDRNDLYQAYRLYTLAVAGSPDLSSMNRLRENKELSNDSKMRLAAAYALVGQKKAAQELLSKSNINFAPQSNDYRTYGSPQRNRAMALETYTIMEQSVKARELMEDLAKNLESDRYYNTQALAYSLVAIGKYADFVGGEGVDAHYTFNGKTQTINTIKSLANRDLDINHEPNSVTVENTGKNMLFITNSVTGKLPVGKEKATSSKLKAIVSYTDRDGNEIDVTKLSQGTEVIVTTTVTNESGANVEHMALTQILPSGWEIVNTRFTEYGEQEEPAHVNYTDIRDDRVDYYFDIEALESKTFKTVMNASYQGSYYLPGIQCEAMYDNDYLVRKEGQWVEVVR
ncbi:alpha-2-macroglobulin family protein [Nonlabens xiamenensis]|uniref:alpha-2-macroglobulin family protein n=1 Tax=Nonlabens xiamenensis TaxID=2341043 RepID=UPI0013DDBB02|nr:MG2 domain-containing protein [Nonlabens xiamenensis]